MIKHTQNNSSATVDELFECVDHFVGFALKELIEITSNII